MNISTSNNSGFFDTACIFRSCVFVIWLAVCMAIPNARADLFDRSIYPSIQKLFTPEGDDVSKYEIKCNGSDAKCFEYIIFDQHVADVLFAIQQRFNGKGRDWGPELNNFSMLSFCIKLGCGPFGDIEQDIREKVAARMLDTTKVFRCVLEYGTKKVLQRKLEYNRKITVFEIQNTKNFNKLNPKSTEKSRLFKNNKYTTIVTILNTQEYLMSFKKCKKYFGNKQIYTFGIINSILMREEEK